MAFFSRDASCNAKSTNQRAVRPRLESLIPGQQVIKTGIAGLIRSGTDALPEVLRADIFTNRLIKGVSGQQSAACQAGHDQPESE